MLYLIPYNAIGKILTIKKNKKKKDNLKNK